MSLVKEDEEKKSGGIQSLARASAILEEIARNRQGIGLAQLSKNVGLHSSTAFHLVKTLVRLGYVHQDEESKVYRIGKLIYSLASAALDEVEMARLSGPFLDELSMRTGETSHIAVRSGTDIVVVGKSEGTGAFRIAERTGISRPAHATALGKILLAAMPAQNLDLFLRGYELRAITSRTITDRQRLEDELEKVRRTGIAYDDGEFHVEVRCIAVPVRNFRGSIVAAMGISTPVWRLSLHDLQEKANLLKGVADTLSATFGFQPEEPDLPQKRTA